MILFVFEGAKREPELFRTIEILFFKDKQNIVCSFGNNIYELYNELKSFKSTIPTPLFTEQAYSQHTQPRKY